MIKRICQNCGQEFWVNSYRKNTAKYHNKECHNKSQIGKATWNKGLTKETDKRIIGGNLNYNICKICGKSFRTSHKKQKCCSKECANIRQSVFLTKQRIKKKCIICGEGFEVLPSGEKQKTCSRECGRLSQRKEQIKKKCKYCGKIYKVKPSIESYSKFCSMRCRNKWQSEFMIGEGNITYGTQLSEETRAKISEANTNPSEETRVKMSERSKKLWENPEFIEKVMNGLKRNPSKPEIFFDNLTPDNVRYVGSGDWWRPTRNKHARNPDFKITGQNKVIEIYGDYWHRNDDPNDLISEYKEVGLECLIFWESEVYKETDRVMREVKEFIKVGGDAS